MLTVNLLQLRFKYILVILLLISPLSRATPLIQSDVSRIILHDVTDSQFTVYNPSNYAGFYNLELIDSKMDESGKISFIENSTKKEFIKFTPTKFYLEPQKKQLVRVRIKNSQNIENELRSNLVIKLQNDYDVGSSELSRVFNFNEKSLQHFSNFDTNLLYVIPVIYDKSPTNIVKIIDNRASLDDDYLKIKFSISREGNSSIYVNIRIYLLDDTDSEEILILKKNNKAIYYPNTTRHFSFYISQKKFKLLYGDKLKKEKLKIVITDHNEKIIDTIIKKL